MSSNAGSRKNGPKGVNWLRARTLFLDGSSISSIAQTLGVRRELVSRRASADGWRTQRDKICTDAAQRIADEAVSSNTEILRRHDRVGDKLLTVAEKRIDEMASGSMPFDSEVLRDVSVTVVRATTIQRNARGIGVGTGIPDRADHAFSITTVRLPATRQEYDALKRAEAAAEGVA